MTSKKSTHDNINFGPFANVESSGINSDAAAKPRVVGSSLSNTDYSEWFDLKPGDGDGRLARDHHLSLVREERGGSNTCADIQEHLHVVSGSLQELEQE